MKRRNIVRCLIGVAMILAMMLGTVGCGEQTSSVRKTPTDIPDYSDSDKEMYIYAHRSGSNGQFRGTFGEMITYDEADYFSLERLQEFKDCGFNVFYSQVTAHWYKGEDFETSYLKQYLDWCEQIGLKMIVEDSRIFSLCSSQESLIGEGKQFATMDDLVETIRDYMQPYINHPAFWGICIEDEPQYKCLQAVSEVCRAVKAVKEDVFLKMCLFPLGGLGNLNSEEFYTGQRTTGATIEHWINYAETYLDLSESEWLAYDKYAFGSDGFNSLFNANLQMAAEMAEERDLKFEVILQSFGMDNGSGVKVLPDLNELYLQNNLALAFGVDNIAYFTYWRPGSGYDGVEKMTGGILDYDGTKMIYDEVQEVIAYTREMASVVMNFDYEKTYWSYDRKADITAPSYFISLKTEKLDKVEVSEVTQPTIITQMFDETNNRKGYMVVNALATWDEYSLPDELTLTFEDYDFVTYYSKEEPKTVPLTDGSITLELQEGEAVFVIPHN